MATPTKHTDNTYPRFAIFMLLIAILLSAATLWWPQTSPLHAATLIPIYAIQGSSATTPFYQQWVDTYGVVTGVVADGFYLQDPVGDGDPMTSDGLFVYTRETPTVYAGQCIQLQRAYVDEFYEKTELSRMKSILSSTQCATATIRPVALPRPRLGHDPATRFEQFEGMLVEFTALTAVVQGPTNHFADGEVEIAVVAADLLPYLDDGRVFQHDAATMTGLLYLTNALGAMLPEVRQGDRVAIGNAMAQHALTLQNDADGGEIPVKISAIIDFNFGKYQLHLWPGTPVTLTPAPVDRRQLESADPIPPNAFSVCTYNLHGMGRGSEQYWEPQEYERQLAKRARTIAETLRGCTIIGLQELGNPTDLDRLAALLQRGFNLDYVAVALPGPGTRSNEFPLTLGLLARSDQVTVQSATLHQGCSFQDYEVVRLEADCTVGAYPLFNRPPLVVDLTVIGPWLDPFPLTIIVNHWKSKGGDENVNVVRRTAQAAHVAAVVQERLASDPNANLIVLGDLNDYYQSAPIETLRMATEPPLIHSYDYLRALDRYTYIFNGGSQVLDHMLVTPHLAPRIGQIDPIHVNADYPSGDNGQVLALQRSSDHDPVLLQIQPAGVGIVGGNLGYSGITVTLTITNVAVGQVAGSQVAPDQMLSVQAVTDQRGDFRLWSVPLGEYELHIDAPAHFNKRTQTGILLVEAGFQTVSPALFVHESVEQAVATMRVAPTFITESH